jgi:hypothetical protein
MNPMKKFSCLLIFGILSITFLKSQNVDSVRIEQAGDLIKIHYKILNSNAYQVFRVTVLCSINGGLKSEIKSISGDFGENVVGGRSDYMVLWDVLKDVDEVKSVDFSVRAELIKDNSIQVVNSKITHSKNTYLLISTEIANIRNIYGIRAGYLSKWGVSGSFLYGERPLSDNSSDGKYASFSICIDLTKRIVNRKKFQMHLLAGVGTIKLKEPYPKTGVNSIGALDGGFIIGFKRISISFSMAALANKSETDTGNLFPVVGIGMRF